MPIFPPNGTVQKQPIHPSTKVFAWHRWQAEPLPPRYSQSPIRNTTLHCYRQQSVREGWSWERKPTRNPRSPLRQSTTSNRFPCYRYGTDDWPSSYYTLSKWLPQTSANTWWDKARRWAVKEFDRSFAPKASLQTASPTKSRCLLG